MSKKYTHSTADVLTWNEGLLLIEKLKKDGKDVLSLFVAVSLFFGTRVSDTLSIRWNMLMEEDLSVKKSFDITEKKTKKYRRITINEDLAKYIKSTFEKIQPDNLDNFIFISQKKSVYSIQRLNVLLKEFRDKYNLSVKNMSCHSLRKGFGAELYKRGDKSENMLIQLSMIFNHSSTAITRRYIGITDQHIAETYELLTF
ncbi:MAG: tyrosine-type recombinase/integrase [Candidatus Izemoplasmatales bacterium]|nr:tyrosine-type recombinase/integrase [Candidatus Izemoplasmatales bacterium]